MAGVPMSSSSRTSPSRTAASRRYAPTWRSRTPTRRRSPPWTRRMPEIDWQFTLLLITNGVMIGLMYALIALGFVLVYKATDAINFAAGEFVMFAGFMAAFGFGLERVVLRPLIGRPVVAVIMATIGVAALLRGFATLVFGAGTRNIDLPVGDEPIQLGVVSVPPVQLVGAVVSLAFLAAFTWFFLKSRTGIAMRAVADSQQVAMAMGINVRRYFALAI